MNKCECIVPEEPACSNNFQSLSMESLQQDIHYNLPIADLIKLGFKVYYDKPPTHGQIKSEIQPPADTKLVFMGCGRISSDMLDVGIIVEPSVLFNQKSYRHHVHLKADDIGRNYHTYYSSGDLEPLGFSESNNIRFGNPDNYDCSIAGNWSAPPAELDAHRVSTYTTHSSSLWRCGRQTASNDSSFRIMYRLMFFYK